MKTAFVLRLPCLTTSRRKLTCGRPPNILYRPPRCRLQAAYDGSRCFFRERDQYRFKGDRFRYVKGKNCFVSSAENEESVLAIHFISENSYYRGNRYKNCSLRPAKGVIEFCNLRQGFAFRLCLSGRHGGAFGARLGHRQ